MRLGIFGGSFDPPHVGHLLAAGDAFERLKLETLFWVPAAAQPLKQGQAVSTAEQRLEMVRQTIGDDPRFRISSVEVERAGLSFTVDTVAHFARQYPDAERYLLLGSDVRATFQQWREPARVLELARVVLLERQTDAEAGMPEELGSAMSLGTRRIDVSSTEIRERVRAGKSIRGFVLPAVEEFIKRNRLYR